MSACRSAIYFGHHQRNVGIHAKCAGFVDHDCAGLDRDRSELARLMRASGEKRDIDILESVRACELHRNRFAGEGHSLADRALGGVGLQIADRKFPLFENFERGLADGAGCANDPDSLSRSHYSILTFKWSILYWFSRWSEYPRLLIPRSGLL